MIFFFLTLWGIISDIKNIATPINPNADNLGVGAYASRREIEEVLNNAGIASCNFYRMGGMESFGVPRDDYQRAVSALECAGIRVW